LTIKTLFKAANKIELISGFEIGRLNNFQTDIEMVDKIKI